MSIIVASKNSAITLLKNPQGGMIEDINPETNIDTNEYVCAIIDNKKLYGHIQKIENRNVTIKLDNPWMRRKYIIVNWTYLRKVNIDQKNKEEEAKKNLEILKENKVEKLKSIILKKNADYFFVDNKMLGDVKNLTQEEKAFFEKNDEIKIIINRIDDLTERLILEKSNMQKQKNICETAGSSKEKLELFEEIIENINIYKTSKTSKNIIKDNKKKLSSIRDVTRELLGMVLEAAGQEGIDSENIIKIIMDLQKEILKKNINILEVTPHRIMGMLSSFSRKKHAFLNEDNMWSIAI